MLRHDAVSNNQPEVQIAPVAVEVTPPETTAALPGMSGGSSTLAARSRLRVRIRNALLWVKGCFTVEAAGIIPDGHKTAYDLAADERDRRLAAYDRVRDHLLALRQNSFEHFDQNVLTLATALLGLSVSFMKEVVPPERAVRIWLLVWSWWFLGGCILSTLLSYVMSRIALTAHIKYAEEYIINCREEYRAKTHNATIATEVLNGVTTALFVSAIGLTLLFASNNLSAKTSVAVTNMAGGGNAGATGSAGASRQPANLRAQAASPGNSTPNGTGAAPTRLGGPNTHPPSH